MTAGDSSQYRAADPSDRAAAALIALRNQGKLPDLAAIWKRFDPRRTVDVLAALVKVDIQCRFRHGERPEVAEYLEAFPVLKTARERIVSLVYEEYYLRERVGEAPDADAFCRRYEPWKDSLASQLRYHQAISQIVGVPPLTTKFPSPGDHFSTFRLRSVLGEGGSARVFLAMDELLGDREVALKVSADRSDEPTIQGRLDHAHIVPVLSVYDDRETGLRGLSMPYRPGLSLDKVIEEIRPGRRPKYASALRQVIQPETAEGTPELEEYAGWHGFPSQGTYAEGVAWVVSIVARALAYAHAHKVFHRDVKPANVLLTFREGPQLLDFNLAAHSAHSTEQAEEALRGGTLPYMAPEQLEAFRDPENWTAVGEAADIFSVGLLLREMLTGERPEGPRQDIPLPWAIRDLLERRERGFGSVRDLNPDTPHALDAVVQRCLANSPSDRYPSANALADDLRRFLEHRPLLHASNPSRSERAGNWFVRSKTALFIGTAAVVVSGLLFLAAFNGVEARNLRGESSDKQKALIPLAQANALLDQKEYEPARVAYKKALSIDPTLFKAHWGLACIEYEQGRTSESLAEFTEALRHIDKQEQTPKHKASFFVSFANLLKNQSKLGQAEQMYERALKVYPDPTMHISYEGLAIAAGEKGDYDRALTYIDKAIKMISELGDKADPVRVDVYHKHRATILFKLGFAALNRKAADTERAKSLFFNGENDARMARRSESSFKKEDQSGLEIAHASLLLGLGDLASGADDYDQSVSLFEQAETCVKAADELKLDRQKVSELRAAVEVRLTTDRQEKQRIEENRRRQR